MIELEVPITMKISLSDDSIPILNSLTSKTRIDIIKLLSSKRMNVSEIAKELKLTIPVVARHINILESAGIIKTERIPGKAGLQKRCILKIDTIEVDFPEKIFKAYETHDVSIPVGQYVDYFVTPTCGLASTANKIGKYDEPKYFMDVQRFTASILWFSSGFVEYKIISPLTSNQQLKMVDITLEISSEFPGGNNVWPSDIRFTLNDIDIGTWTSSGDFIDTRGRYNPDWYSSHLNQYGTKVTLRLTDYGCWINGKQASWNTYKQLNLSKPVWKFRLSSDENAVNAGGCTVFGKGFGNHNQDINFRYYYTDNDTDQLPESTTETK